MKKYSEITRINENNPERDLYKNIFTTLKNLTEFI